MIDTLHARDGMVLVPAGRFRMGSERFYPEEAPVREVAIESFLIDACPVTNRQFAVFVEMTGYVTVAERALDAADFPRVPPDQLKPGALVFQASGVPLPLHDWMKWWRYEPGAHWRCPEGRSDVFADRLDHPVVCVAWEDAAAYARWAGKALPSEAQWEYAARGGRDGAEYAWGDEFKPGGRRMANTWDGDAFPCDRHGHDRPFRTTAVGIFPSNGYGLYDMVGNVWEWTKDWYRTGSSPHSPPACCATPPADSYDPAMPSARIPRRVLKGGSFLCSPDYCARYRPAARQPQTIDTASVHIGFRCVAPVSSGL